MKNSYATKWIIQRISAIFLIPLSFWFIYQCLSFQNLKYVEIEIFFQSYLNCFLFLIMMVSMLIHARIGCETIVKDYISNIRLKNLADKTIKYITIFSLFLVIFAIIKINIF